MQGVFRSVYLFASRTHLPTVGIPDVWVRRLIAKGRKTDVLERAILLQGTCPECNLPTKSVARAFSLVVGPGVIPSLPASLLEASGTGRWRACGQSHEWLVGIEWREAVLRCWRCQRPHGTERSPPPCPTCGAAVDIDRISVEYGRVVPCAASAMGIESLQPEAFECLDWTQDPQGLIDALLGRPSQPGATEGDAAAAPAPSRPRPSFPALREIYASSSIVKGGVPYSLLGLLGKGGFSKVHLAQAPEGRFVVLKEAWGYRTENEKGTDERLNAYLLAVRKLRAEGEYLRQFAGNARIPQYVESFEWEGSSFLAMEFIHGPNLREYVHAMSAAPNRGLEIDEALRIFKQAADVVRAIHGSHKVHRDLTPRNFLMRAGNPILIDFGTVASDTGPTLEVATGISAGGYHAPEQARGVASRLCDIFSLGSCLYFLLTGRDPPQATRDGRAEQSMAAEMGRQGVPPAVQTIVVTSRAWNAADRFGTVDLMVTMVHLFEHPELRVCSSCGTYVERGQRRCPGCGLRHCSGCGAALGTQTRCSSCSRVTCRWCDTAMRPCAEFCSGCGTSQASRACPECGRPAPAEASFCRSCGSTFR